MARTQAADYGERQDAMLAAAAAAFARDGFASASLADIARACGVSKSLVYHYHASKEDMLFAVMRTHLAALRAAGIDAGVNNADQSAAAPPRARLQSFARALMREYAGARHAQKVLLNELDALAPDRRAMIVREQRALVAPVTAIVGELRPGMTSAERWAAAMLFFGMINWTHTWWDPAGALDADAVARMAADTFLNGLAQAS